MNVVELKQVTKRFGTMMALDGCSFGVEAGKIVSLLGPSGCGKTTTLRLIAGFEDPDEGVVSIGGKAMQGQRPYERNVGLLFQDYALFPHMSVEENVRYGLRQRGFDRNAVAERTAEMLRLVKLPNYEKRRPSQLSGGQQQRVALARALATKPEVLLLDEPLSALDAKLRQELQVELKEILRNADSTSIVVTHDQEEAMSLGDYIFVMNNGKIVQRGTPEEIYARPQSKFVAEFIGRSNWFKGALHSDARNISDIFVTADGHVLRVPGVLIESGRTYEVCVRPERIAILDDGERDIAREEVNILPGKMVDRIPLGAANHVVVALDSGQRISVLEKNVGAPPPAPGAILKLGFSRQSCIVLPAEG